jgi:hypothetical protein
LKNIEHRNGIVIVHRFGQFIGHVLDFLTTGERTREQRIRCHEIAELQKSRSNKHRCIPPISTEGYRELRVERWKVTESAFDIHLIDASAPSNSFRFLAENDLVRSFV